MSAQFPKPVGNGLRYSVGQLQLLAPGTGNSVITFAQTALSFGNGTDNPTFTFNGTGLAQINGGLQLTGARPAANSAVSQMLFGATTGGVPQMWWINSTGAADSKIWDSFASGTDLQFRLINDANNSATTWLDVTRSGTAVSAVAFAGPLTVGSPSSATSAQSITQSNSGQAVLDFHYTNTAVGTATQRFLNSSASAQSEIDFFANGTNTGRLRNDFQGSMSYVAFTGSGTHTFWVRGDSGVGAISLQIAAAGGVSVAAPSSGFALTASGDCAFGLSSNTVRFNVPTHTTASAGGTGALPATVLGYAEFNIAGNFVAVPYYFL